MQSRQTSRQAGYNPPPCREPGRRPRPAPPWATGTQPRRGRRFAPAFASYYQPTQTHAQYQNIHNPYYQYNPNYQFYAPTYQLYDPNFQTFYSDETDNANFQSFHPNYQLFGMYNQAQKQAAPSTGASNVSQQQEQHATVELVKVAPPTAPCSSQGLAVAVMPQPPAAHQASHIPTNQRPVDNNARKTLDPPPAHQQAPAQVAPKPPDPDPRPLIPCRPQSQQLAILPKPEDHSSKNSGVLVQRRANQSTTSHAPRRRNVEKGAETKIRHQTLSQWPLAPRTVCQTRDGVVGGTQVMYQPDTQTLEAAQVVYEPFTDTYATAQIVYQPRTNTLAASHLLYHPQTDKIATAEAVYRPQADDEIMMTTRQTNYEPQANEITTTEAVYQPKADCITSRRVCIQTETDEVTTTEAVYRPQANILAAREMNIQPQKNEVRATEGVYRPNDDIQAKRQTKVCLQSNEVKTTEAIYRPRADILQTRVTNFQPETNVLKTTETISHPQAEADGNFYCSSSSTDKNSGHSKADTRRIDGGCRIDLPNANRPGRKETRGSNTTVGDYSASILRQILSLDEEQEELQTSSCMSRQNMKVLDQLQRKHNTKKSQTNPDEATPQKVSLRETRKRKLNTTQAVTPTKKTAPDESVALSASEWLARLDSLASSKSASLQRQEDQSNKLEKLLYYTNHQSTSGCTNSSTLQKQHGATLSPEMLNKEPVPKKRSRQTRPSPKTTKSPSSANTTQEPTPSSIPMSWHQLWNWEARCQSS